MEAHTLALIGHPTPTAHTRRSSLPRCASAAHNPARFRGRPHPKLYCNWDIDVWGVTCAVIVGRYHAALQPLATGAKNKSWLSGKNRARARRIFLLVKAELGSGKQPAPWVGAALSSVSRLHFISLFASCLPPNITSVILCNARGARRRKTTLSRQHHGRKGMCVEVFAMTFFSGGNTFVQCFHRIFILYCSKTRCDKTR